MRRYLAVTACGIGALASVLAGTSALALAWDVDGHHRLLSIHPPCIRGAVSVVEFARTNLAPFEYHDDVVEENGPRVRSLTWPGGMIGVVTNAPGACENGNERERANDDLL